MKDIKEIYVIYNPYDGRYYDGNRFGGILFAKKYSIRDIAVIDVSNILSKSTGIEYLKIQKLYTNG
jgi:hypothetical protein